ncbi:MAG: hypothetical protein RBT47_11060, partial [Anaerolineae bacterium]|nr:hypothetical protein [Anaerolineae bacterium]
MNTQTPRLKSADAATSDEYALGFYTALLTSVLTLVTFGIAFFTPPISGPSCQANCITYPFTDIVARFPRDYIWMYPAMLMMVLFVALMACIHQVAAEPKKLYSRIGLAFAIISAGVLITDYFVQVSVIQPSLVNGETEGIALLTQYNPHGIFIALEELGFLLMSFAFFCIAPVFSGANRVERALRWIFRLSFVLALGALIGFSFAY